MSDFSQVVLSDRLFGYIKFLGDMTSVDQQETGGFLIKTGVGMSPRSVGVRLVNLVRGEGKEIFLEAQENLEPGEEYLGTFHSHPLTDVPSIHDVLTFLSDPTEQVSIVRGVSGTINLMVKKPETRPLDPTQIETLKPQYQKGDMTSLVRDFGFMFFQGQDANLVRAFEIQPVPTDQAVSLDELSYGITGTQTFPEQSKKMPGMPEGTATKKYFWHMKPDYRFDEITRKWVPKK